MGEFVMEGISGDTSLMIGSFQIKQWTTSITVEKLLIQENIATKSSLLNRAFFTNEKKEGDEGSDEDTTVAILNSPTNVYIKSSMSQMTIKNNQRDIEGRIVQKDTEFCKHSEWILPKPSSVFVGPAFSGSKIIVSSLTSTERVRFRMYDDVDVDENDLPHISNYEDKDHYVDPGKMTTVVLDNPNARIISIFSDSDVIVGSIRIKPGNDHVYKYQKDDG